MRKDGVIVNNRPLQKIKHLQDGGGMIFADHGTEKGELSDPELDPLYFCTHRGTSMNPTLCESDLLEIEVYGDRSVRIGDVIFFLLPEGDQPVVHRVVHISPEGIRTKGDSNSRIDPWIIHPEDVIGQVARAARGKKRRPIYGGTAGRLWSLGIGGVSVLARALSFFYHRLARSGFLRRLLPFQKWMRIISISRTDGKSFKLLLGNWVIGNYQPGMNYWQIRRPFRLFVDVTSLPK